jgi:EmrB/QacA subfamily drug resistance transporter
LCRPPLEVLDVLVVEDFGETAALPPPQAAIASAAAAAARTVSMAVSGVRLIGRSPVLARGLGRSPYQAFTAPPARVSLQTPPRTEPQPSPPPQAAPRRLRSRQGWLLAVCCVAQFMVILDLSIVNVALPHIQSALGFSSPELQWIVDAYAITFAGFLMLGGRVADHFGQRRVFVIALALFALASLAGGLAQDRDMLIGARALQGLAGAFMAASSLAIITASFEPGPKLNRAIGAWAAMNGLGGAAGMLFGGLITEFLSWRWVFLINPPIGLAAAAVAYLVVLDIRRRRETNFDVAGAITLTAGQMVLVYGVVEAGLRGWDTAIALGPILGGIALLVVFGVIEARIASAPLIPFKELTKPLRIANNIVLLFSASLFPMWFVSSLYLQQVLGLSPLHAGLIFLPMTLMIALSASRAGKLVGRFGVRTVLGGGLLMLAVGQVLLARIAPSGSPIVYVMIPGLLACAGIGMSIVPSTIAATQGAKPGQAGLASGLVNTSRQVGGGLGLAIFVTLATQRSSHLIGLGHGVPASLTAGFRLAYLIGAGCVAVAALMTFAFVERRAGGQAEASSEGRAAGQVGADERAKRALPVAGGVALVLAAFLALDLAFAGNHGAPVGAYVTDGTHRYVTQPSLHPPKIEIEGTTDTSRLAPGYILTANFYNINFPPMIGQSGPMILDDRMQPVWFQPVPENVVAGNLSLQRYEGKPALAWWQGLITNTGETESGEDVVVNQHYQTVARIKGVDGWKLTLHEILISGHDVWVTANKDVPMNLSPYGGAYNGTLVDSAVQEYDLRTGRLLYDWDALKRIPLGESEASIPTNGFPWDAYHVNSLQLVGREKFLVSMRDTWAAYLVNIKTGRIEWTLGGKKSSYRFGQGAAFEWQHDVRLQPNGTVTMFDDHCCQLTGGGTYVHASEPSRGLVLKLDEGAHTASKIADYGGGYGIDSDYMGDTQPLPNGNVFVGFGSEPYLDELTSSGNPVLEGKLPGNNLTYRATLAPWVGLPLTKPAAAARQVHGRTVVYASWNGATQVATWRVLAGPSANATRPVATAARSGFETAIPLPSRSTPYRSFRVQALDAKGRIIGASKLFSLGG